ncbi:MAG: cyclopropane-fatty-acyl-phospholipid synthase [Rhodobacteraceae bacterium]|nr:cyclopropane-fatty-acyl-phospholipid synthase [Paracoccaceae bacterium]MBO27406.1 cyclopropane-fatty-acyl-phospholipid synthase [Paracoccaceae bacterium]
MAGKVEHIAGETYHGRNGDIANAFRYSIDYILLDAELPTVAPWPFRRNRRGVFALRDQDHGGAPGAGRGAPWVRSILADYGVDGVARIELLAQPHILGHVFNPVSFWLCYDKSDELVAVIAEVTNTYGDRHSYLCRHADGRPLAATDQIEAEKVFHVSPFQPVEGRYTFRFDISDRRIGIWIAYDRPGGGLLATLTGRRKPLTTAGMFGAMLRRPFGSRRVQALIHWQALKLWWKGARFRSRPEPPKEEVTR